MGLADPLLDTNWVLCRVRLGRLAVELLERAFPTSALCLGKDHVDRSSSKEPSDFHVIN